jgi:hypothetical protein
VTFINTGAGLQSARQTSRDTVSHLVAPLCCSDSQRRKANVEFIRARFLTLPHQGWLRGFLNLSSADYEGFWFRDERDLGLKLTAFLFVMSRLKLHGNVHLT